MDNLNKGRMGFEALGNTYPVAENVIREDITIADIPCSWFIPADAAQHDIVIYIHGGAFIFGSVNSHAPMVSHIARELKRKVLIIDYSLAPEHPFPAGLNDCIAVIKAFIEQNPDINFGIIGDSAGSNIAMAAGLMLIENKGPSPQYTIVISPWVDLECKNPSYERNKMTETVLARSYLITTATMYAPGHDLSALLISPVNGSFKTLTPVLILCGTCEILQDDAINLHKRLVEDGVEAELKQFEGQPHVWPFLDINTMASHKALREMANFVARH